MKNANRTDVSQQPEPQPSLETLLTTTTTVPRLLSPKEFCEWSGMQKQTAALRRMQGKPPRFYKIGKLIRYDANDVLEWLKENRCANTVQSTQRAAKEASNAR